jgi:DNA polymerase elongation subunit (family B)
MIDEGWTSLMVSVETDDELKALYMREPETESNRLLRIKMGKGLDRTRVWEEFKVPDTSEMKRLFKPTALHPGSNTCVYPLSSQTQSFLRICAICGYGPFCSPGFGPGHETTSDVQVRAVGLDLEQTTYYRQGSFPLPGDPLLSAAIVTWDGRRICRYTTGTVRTEAFPRSQGYDVEKVSNSAALVEWIFNWINFNSPDLIFIHFGYKFDVVRICAHASPMRSNCFTVRNLGKLGKGMDLVLPETVVVDTHWFLDKVHRSEYESLSLDSIAIELGLEGKSEQPSLAIPMDSNQDVTKLVYYNIHDSFLHLAVGVKSGCADEVLTLSKYFKCPLTDSTRYITGTMVSTMISSYALSQGKVLDWSEDAFTDMKVEGALVLRPRVGYSSNVTLMDFASMYPSIMLSLNISPETVHLHRKGNRKVKKKDQSKDTVPSMRAGAIWWDENNCYTSVQGLVSRIDTTSPSVSHSVLRYLIARRKEVGSKTRAGWALKVGANSIYGCFASNMSGLFNYLAGSSVTLAGRWMLTVVQVICYFLGYSVIYGDTDSVFISPRTEGYVHERVVVQIVKRVFSFTPLTTVSLEFEKHIRHMILLDKKMYFGFSSDVKPTPEQKHKYEFYHGSNNYLRARSEVEAEMKAELKLRRQSKLKSMSFLQVEENVDSDDEQTQDDQLENMKEFSKGIASKRKDRSKIVRDSVLAVCKIICKHHGRDTAIPELAAYMGKLKFNLEAGLLDFLYLVNERRKGGVMYLEYKNENKVKVLVRKEDFNPLLHQCSIPAVFESIRSNCDRILSRCTLPTIESLIQIYTE